MHLQHTPRSSVVGFLFPNAELKQENKEKEKKSQKSEGTLLINETDRFSECYFLLKGLQLCCLDGDVLQ